jgi:hypothetical protein
MNPLSNDVLTLCDTSNIGMLLRKHGEALGGALNIASVIPAKFLLPETLRGPALVWKF